MRESATSIYKITHPLFHFLAFTLKLFYFSLHSHLNFSTKDTITLHIYIKYHTHFSTFLHSHSNFSTFLSLHSHLNFSTKDTVTLHIYIYIYISLPSQSYIHNIKIAYMFHNITISKLHALKVN